MLGTNTSHIQIFKQLFSRLDYLFTVCLFFGNTPLIFSPRRGTSLQSGAAVCAPLYCMLAFWFPGMSAPWRDRRAFNPPAAKTSAPTRPLLFIQQTLWANTFTWPGSTAPTCLLSNDESLIWGRHGSAIYDYMYGFCNEDTFFAPIRDASVTKSLTAVEKGYWN